MSVGRECLAKYLLSRHTCNFVFTSPIYYLISLSILSYLILGFARTTTVRLLLLYSRVTTLFSGRERAMEHRDDPALQALRLRAVHLMSAASRAAARVEVATAHHKAAALRSGAVKGQVGRCDEWADAVTNESVTRNSEESARRVALGSARAARGATARATAIEDHMQVFSLRENRLAVKQQRIRDRQVAAVEQTRVRSAQTMRWAGMCHAEEEAQVAWRWKLHEQKARDKRREEAAVQREAAAATRTAVLIKERTRTIEKRLVASHDVDNDGTLNAAEYQQLVAGVAGDGRVDAGDFQRILA